MSFNEIHFDEISGETVICDENFNYVFNIYSDKEPLYPSNNIKIRLTEGNSCQNNNQNSNINIDNSFTKNSENNNIINNNINNVNQDELDKKKIKEIKEIKEIKYLPSARKHSYLPSAKNIDRNFTLKEELLYLLKFYFKSKNIEDLLIEKNIIINRDRERSSSPNLKSDFSSLDRKFILGKIKKYIEDCEIGLDKGITRTPLFKTIKVIFVYLIENENIAINFRKKIKESNAKYIKNKLNNLNIMLKKYDLKANVNQSLISPRNKISNLNGINTENGKNKFVYFKKIFPDGEKQSIAYNKIEDLSFLSMEGQSFLDDNDNFYRKYKDNRVKTLEENIIYMKKEQERLNGFIYPEIKEIVDIPIVKSKLKSNGEFYVKSMELLKKGK
jgi:hypothetical protein